MLIQPFQQVARLGLFASSAFLLGPGGPGRERIFRITFVEDLLIVSLEVTQLARIEMSDGLFGLLDWYGGQLMGAGDDVVQRALADRATVLPASQRRYAERSSPGHDWPNAELQPIRE